jgi:hypothetical protein
LHFPIFFFFFFPSQFPSHSLFLFSFSLSLISLYESCTKRRAGSVATSRALLGRPIERTDGPDRASAGYFAKRPSNYGKIKPAVQQPLIKIFAKRPSIFLENEARSILHSAPYMGRFHGPAGLNSAQQPFIYFQ